MLKFEALESSVDPTFWDTLGRNKMDLYRLDDSMVPIQGYYRPGSTYTNNNKKLAPPGRLGVSGESFSGKNIGSDLSAPGMLKNTNTLGDFKEMDKNLFLKEAGLRIWDHIVSGDAVKHPQLLTSFTLVTFADLKKYKYFYWFAFPAIVPKAPCICNSIQQIGQMYTEEQQIKIRDSYRDFKTKYNDQSGFFLLKGSTIGRLQDWERFWDKDDIITVGYIDPCSSAEYPGWFLRNLLVLIQTKWNISHCRIFCYRENRTQSIEDSIILEIKFEQEHTITKETISVVGWEKGPSGSPTPRLANLAPMMDPKQIANTAVDLNLKLMKWKIMPSLELGVISQSKCLLLGAGTLGCYVSRMLMAWGVRNITFVDNGKVSFSNPVRQPLYSFQDCLEGGKGKAEQAAKALKDVFPGVNARGVDLSIPMPGHNIDSQAKSVERLETLEDLIKTHDCIFLLTDSRESRWLPTVLGAYHEKIVINTALGFDSFLVMRHGMRRSRKSELGCYFCNDVVAPTDSLSDRTLDQQCTVTRPGLSGIASALAVELLASILNHPEGPHAKAETAQDTPESPLGIVPHQIRGFLGQFNNMVLTGSAYDKCTACSPSILEEYSQRGKDFVLDVLRHPQILEIVSGLEQMKLQSDAVDIDGDWDV